MNTLYLQMETETLLNNAPLTRNSCRMIKRTFDIITALIVLVLIFPWVYLIIACCIKIFMPGPIFFKQKRTGKDGAIFTCYKFRTMDAKNHSDEFIDPQLNKYSLGNFLRSTSLDELPQFWNVLIGDMSIIGPRPHMLVHDEEYMSKIEEYPLRYAGKARYYWLGTGKWSTRRKRHQKSENARRLRFVVYSTLVSSFRHEDNVTYH